MRTASLHLSSSPVSEPLNERFRQNMEAPKVTESSPVAHKDLRTYMKVESRSSNSTSWSTGSSKDEGRRPRNSREVRKERGIEQVSLQAAFAARKGNVKSESLLSGEDDPFQSKPKIANESRQILSSNPSSSVVPARDYDELPAVASASDFGPSLEDRPKPMKPCMYCERRFNEDVIPKHEDICRRQKKRPKFDSRNHRLAGLQQAGLPGKPSVISQRPEEKPIPVKKASWREKSDQLRAAIGAARATDPFEKKRFEEDLARATKATMTRCEFCGRSFNAEAAQRHIPFCRNKAMMIPRTLPGKVSLAGTGASVQMPHRVPRMPPVRSVSGMAPVPQTSSFVKKTPPARTLLRAPSKTLRSPSTVGSRMRF